MNAFATPSQPAGLFPPSRTIVVATSVRPAAESTVLTAQNTECQQADICANPGPSIAVLAPPTAPRASSPCAGCCPGGTARIGPGGWIDQQPPNGGARLRLHGASMGAIPATIVYAGRSCAAAGPSTSR